MEPRPPSAYTPLSRWFGNEREREFDATRQAWAETEAAWRASPLGREDRSDRVLEFLRAFAGRYEREPPRPLVIAMCMAADGVFALEDPGAIEPTWPAIDNDAVIAVNFRKVLQRRRRYALDYLHIHGIITGQLEVAFRTLLAALPEACWESWPEEGSALEVPLIELVDEPGVLIHRLYLSAYTDETMTLGLFESLREQLVTNLMVASGLPPDANPQENAHRLKMPSARDDLSPSELLEAYLGGTPFAQLLELPVPLSIPDEVRFEHAHILGGTGHGKTQLLQRMIHADLVAAKDDGRSVVVVDSQGDLISKLVRLDLFDPDEPGGLWERLVLVDPSDIEFPASLNLFDAHLDRVKEYRPADRERVLNGVVELYETMFGDMLGAELTQKQGVVFRYLARLMITIPGATIHTLMRLMEDGKAFKPQMEKLEGSARYFFETEFFHPSFAATKKQILRRLWGVLSTPAFERMFAQPTNKLDLFEATKDGKIVLISTAKDLLKRDGSALLGRFFITMLAQAALERSVLAPEERTATFVYVDEAQEYFDEGVETILQQARKYRIGLTLAHQSLDQASPKLRSALFSNTSFKAAGGVSAKDARALADELHTSADFIESMRRRHGRTEFAAWIKHWTPSAIRLSVPLGYLERQPILTEEAYDGLIELNRARYCGSLDELLTAYEAHRGEGRRSDDVAPADFKERTARDEREERSDPPPIVPEPITLEPAARPMPAADRELGKGGKKHRYLQNLVKGLAEEQGFRATIEAPIEGGQVDGLLERDGMTVAVEVSITTPVEWERQNLRKCLAATIGQVVLVLGKSERTARRYREAVVDGLSEPDLARLTILYADDIPAFLESLGPQAEPDTSIVKGYRVKVSSTPVSPKEAAVRRDALARIVSQGLARQP